MTVSRSAIHSYTHLAEKALPGFLLSGFLMAIPGAILPAWRYYRDPPAFGAVGTYFLSFAVGLAISAFPGRRSLVRRGISSLLVCGCAISCAALIYLAAISPPLSSLRPIAGLFTLGIGAGLLNVGLLHAISPMYDRHTAAALSRTGVWYGSGCLAATALLAATFSASSTAGILILMAAVPTIFAGLYARAPMANGSTRADAVPHQRLGDFRSPAAVLFALLLFFQFGNEWSIAGWLPLFLIRRVGLSPTVALSILSLYWLFLLSGRWIAARILPHVRHGRVLAGSAMAALFGCLILFFTDNAFGAATSVLFIGGGYAAIYPLAAENIGRRLSYYHPGFFNGIFSIATLGGLLAPASLGYAASVAGIGVVIAIPLIGTCFVVALLLLIWLESRVTGR